MGFRNERPLTPVRHAEQQALLHSNLLGVRRQESDTQESRQNFALLRPVNPLGVRLFIHGRELFSPEAAARYFSDPASFPCKSFGEGAQEKIRDLLSPASLDRRIADYLCPDNELQLERWRIDELKRRYPRFNVPDLPPIDAESAYMTNRRIALALEKQGIEPDEPPKAELEEKCRAFTGQKLAEAMQQLQTAGKEKLAERFHDALTDYLSAHRWDPEIVSNFVSGVSEGAAVDSLEAILERGIEIRTERLLRQAAAQITNPYDPAMVKEEERVAAMLVKAVQTRVLRAALRAKTVILATNRPGMDVFHETLNYGKHTWAGAGGVFTSGGRLRDGGFIFFSSGGETTGPRFAAHEAEHQRDLTQQIPFAKRYQHLLPAYIEADRSRIVNAIALLKKFMNTPESCFAPEKEKLRALDKKIGFNFLENVDLEKAAPETLGKIASLAYTSVSHVYHRCCPFLMPDENHLHYGTKRSQYDEIPAILTDLKETYSAAALRELLPNLYNCFVMHRAQNAGLRDDPEAARSR